MKITGIETFCLHDRMPYALTYARGEYDEREALLVKVHTDEPGLFGWGEAAMWGGPWATSVAVHRARDRAAHRRSRSAAARIHLGARLSADLLPRAQGHPACLSLRHRHRALGHPGQGCRPCRSGGCSAVSAARSKPMRRPAITGATTGWTISPRDVAAARKAGYLAYKMKIGNIDRAIHARTLHETPLRVTFAEDIARVAAAREAIGADGELMCRRHDIARCQDGDGLCRRLRTDRHPLVRGTDAAGEHRGLRRTRSADLASPSPASRPKPTSISFAALMDAGAIQVVQPDVIQVGGITEARKIAAYAQMRHLLFTCKNYSTAVSLAACLNLSTRSPTPIISSSTWIPRRGDQTSSARTSIRSRTAMSLRSIARASGSRSTRTRCANGKFSHDRQCLQRRPFQGTGRARHRRRAGHRRRHRPCLCRSWCQRRSP